MKWSDIIYIALIAGLAVFAFRSCKTRQCPELLCPDVDSLVALVDSIGKLPTDTVYIDRIVSKTVVKTVVKVDTLSLEPPIRSYVTVNDTSSRAYTVDTIVVQGELLEHRQSITFTEEQLVVYQPVPELVYVHDTIAIAKQVFTPIPEKWSISAGAQGGYIFDKPYIAPALEVEISKWNFSVAKPINNATSFTVQASYRLFAR